MPKQEVGSTKWLGNKMKAKGLQKLRWYCQMCQKQCRDENGFKCHRMSDGHQRQMQCFVQDPNRFMDEFSQEFETGFMQLMSHTYRSTRVLANTVYCDLISNRHHTHMNSTIWVTLSNFVQYLGRTNQCKIEKTPKGWYISYIDNSPEAQLREKQKNDLDRADLAVEDRHNKDLQDKIKNAGEFIESEFTELQREEGDAPITFAMGSKASNPSAPGSAAALLLSPAELAARAASKNAPSAIEGENVLEQAFQQSSRKTKDGKDAKASRKLSVVEQVRMEHEDGKAREAAKRRRVEPSSSSEDGSSEPWLAAGLVVKVMHEELAGGKYHRKKGLVEKVHDQYTADIRMVDSKDLIRLEQEMLETVIPNVGKPVRVVKGTHKGARATMRAVDFESFSVDVELEDGTVMEGLGYDEVCKVDK